MTRRNRNHSGVEANVVFLLKLWDRDRAEPRGRVHCGEVGFRIRRDPETFVGIDVAYASAELVAATDPTRPYYDGPPVLAVEILSPSDTHEEIIGKVALYLEAGTTVWEVDPDVETVRVHRPGQLAEMFNAAQEIVGDPELPGFRAPVARFFE